MAVKTQAPGTGTAPASSDLHDAQIVIIDDDPEMCRLVATILTGAGAEVRTATGAWAGLQMLTTREPDLVILDIMMPGLDGWDTLGLIGHYTRIPTILLSGLAGERHVIHGLDLGAVDYVTKPFSPALLLARVRAALRAASPAPDPAAPAAVYRDDHLSVNLFQRLVRVRGRRVPLTDTEFRLLAHLMRNADRVVPKAEIVEAVWGEKEAASSASLHVFISRLRQKLERDPGRPGYLLTHHGRGYRLRLGEPA